MAKPRKQEETTYTYDDLRKRYEDLTALAVAECSLTTELVGGVPADKAALLAYAVHHLGLEGAQAAEAVARIQREEIGEREVPSETGELKEKRVYAVNVIRRDAHGPYLGHWMVKACLKQAASRVGLFQDKRGSKGDMAEMGEVRAAGFSLRAPERPDKIYLMGPDGKQPTETYFQCFSGRVQTPQGSNSIVTQSECAPIGTRFMFEFRFPDNRISQDDVVSIFAGATVTGLGSVKSFERGKFRIQTLSFRTSRRGRKHEAGA